MADFVNTIDALGDGAVFDSIIKRAITEFKDNVVTEVGKFAFYNCAGLKTAEIPNAETVGEAAFQNCNALATLNVQKATSIGPYSFRDCHNLKTISLPGITQVPLQAMAYCKALQSVDFPKVTQIGNSAFHECKSLASVNLPLVTRVSGDAFRGCTALTELCLPKATRLDSNSVRGCAALVRADFPMMTRIDDYTFPGCNSLTALILRGETVATLAGPNVFSCVGETSPIAEGTGYIYVPSALIDSYKAAANWSSFADQFRKLEEWTVDGTVTGAFDTNRHMVRFFNEDGTLLGYKVVAHGASAAYDGTPVNPEDASLEFLGFEPEPTNVTADMDCYAQYKPNVYTWPLVFSAIADGTYKSIYAIGDTVPLDLGSEGLVNMQIVAFDTDDLANGSGKAPITWIGKELLKTKKRMGPANVSNVGWEKCELRAYLNETIKPLIPTDVFNAIKPVTKTQKAYGEDGKSYTQTTTEDIWIPSQDEVSGQYEMFNSDASRMKQVVGSASATHWWLRNAYNYTSFSRVNADGSFGSHIFYEYGIALSFCT